MKKTNCAFPATEGLKSFEALRREAKENGISGLSLEEINKEIHAACYGENPALDASDLQEESL